MGYTGEKDIYIKLMEDITGLKIDPNTPILQSQEELKGATEEAKKLDEALKHSRDEFQNNLNIKDLRVGCAPENEVGYVEPCPIQYMGNIKQGKKFHCVFLGLNPHLEPWRSFPVKSTFADLANFHHPDDVHYNLPKERYSPSGTMKNNYWRVMGNMEPEYGKAWSDYYTFAIRIHLALLPNGSEDIYNKWEDLKSVPNLTNHLLAKLTEFPVANLELVPYKSTNFSISKFENLFQEDNNDVFAKKYRAYFYDMMDFVNKYATDDAYIIATASTATLDVLYKVLKRYKKTLFGTKEEHFFVYNKIKKQLDKGGKKPNELAPMYLFKWGNLKIIVTSPISGNNTGYKFIYTDFENGWIDAIKGHSFAD